MLVSFRSAAGRMDSASLDGARARGRELLDRIASQVDEAADAELHELLANARRELED